MLNFLIKVWILNGIVSGILFLLIFCIGIVILLDTLLFGGKGNE